ncbi:MAG: hypothetical protein IKP40_00590 [Clostridia bacterium]|nr:hypothetical protein [Clostridia bacterium]
MSDAVKAARAVLGDVTPLWRDCGAGCGAACCASLPGEETGMLLFPGEAEMYREAPGFRVEAAAQGALLICPGTCRREERPLSCRLFPLLPLLREDAIRVAMDARARAVCPLARQGVKALREDFVEAVRAAGRLLAEEEESRAFLLRLTREQDEWKALRRTLGG